MAGFEYSRPSDPAGRMAGFGGSSLQSHRKYLPTVSRSIPSSRAILRRDQFRDAMQ
jgi:hypothetical protein